MYKKAGEVFLKICKDLNKNYQEIDGELISYSDINIIKKYSYEN